MAKILEYNATVAAKKQLHDTLLILTITPDQDRFLFVPGQYATLGLKQSEIRVSYAAPEKQPEEDPSAMIRRAYSIASPPDAKNLEFYLAMVEDGTLTPRLFALEEGSRLYITQKAVGRFTLQEVDPSKDLLLLSTGTGLAPYISMLKHQFDWSADRRVVIMHGVRYFSDLGYRDELEALASKHENLHYFPIVSRPEASWSGDQGYIQDILFSDDFTARTQVQLHPERVEVFLCGNPAMIHQTVEKLENKQFQVIKARTPGNIHIEEYW
ncbi:MAG: ferredoxin--NADP reductase [Deltaproteobacteria bacterium]|nr:ferredoxin--NADP reductase [Deltaproteobacteria bacterium]